MVCSESEIHRINMSDTAIDAGVRMGQSGPETLMYTRELDLRGLLEAANEKASGVANDQAILP